MTITKYDHACLVLEKQGSLLVIDPGSFAKGLDDLKNVVAVVITHEHADHHTEGNIEKIINNNPKAVIFAPRSVIDVYQNQGKLAKPGESVLAGPFSLSFTGGTHAQISPLIPLIDNIGVIVDGGALYYSGDSYVPPYVAIDVLAVPAHAPWMKMDESMSYISAVSPKRVFATHNGFLNEEGKALADRLLSLACEASQSTKYIPLANGHTIECM